MFKHKLKATSYHLLLSFFVISLFFSVLIYSWFPEPYFTATGGWQGLKLIAAIDLVLGPLLTFIIYNPQKKNSELKRDLSIIVTLQLLVLIWGIHIVYSQRPIAIVFWNNSFKTVSASDIHPQYLDSKLYKDISNSPLQFFVVEHPASLKEKEHMLDLMSRLRIAPHQQISLYKKINVKRLSLENFTINIDKAFSHNMGFKQKLEKILKKNKANKEDYLYIPLLSKYQNIVLIFNKQQQYLNFIKTEINEST